MTTDCQPSAPGRQLRLRALLLLVLGLVLASGHGSAAHGDPSVTAISAGSEHTCALRSDGSLACWGYNFNGEASAPAGSFTAISAGANHTCGVRSAGTLACWGLNNYGQGDSPVGTFSAVSAGSYLHTCGIRSDGSLACWGYNANGQATPPAGIFVGVSAGRHHTCGVRSDASLACWGLNVNGQASAPAGSFSEVNAGDDHTCGVRSDGSLACWGYNANGQATPPAGSFTAVSAGHKHTCGVRSNGILACWGANLYGQATPPAGTLIAVSAGLYHTCGLRGNGSLACWGYDTSGQAPQLALLPAALPTGSANAAYGLTLVLTDEGYGANARYVPPTPGFAVIAGTLPAGLTLTAAGVLSGTPSAGTFNFTIEGEDANGFTAQRAYVLNIQPPPDSTPPVIVPTVTGTLGDNGWYTGNVGISWSVSDNGSAITAIAGCNPVTLSTDAASAGYTCSASSAGGNASETITVKRDASPPETNLVSGPDNPSSSANATFAFSGSDPLSGVAGHQCRLDAGAFAVCATGKSYSGLTDGTHNFAVRAVDAAGNVDATPATYAWTIETDSTPPVIVPTVSGTLGNNGWYTSNVTISWAVSDADSAISASTGCNTITLTSDALSAGYTCSATSAGGSVSNTVTLKRDATAPLLTPTVTPNVILLNGSGTAAANASDALSGVATQGCAALQTASIGSRTTACTSTDNAGNSATASAPYSVIYGFIGLSSPVDPAPTVNVANAGQAIPLKWKLVDASGTPVTNLASVTISVVAMSCSSGATADAVEEYAAGASALQNLGGGYYQYNWKSPKSYQNTCQKLVLDLGDGSTRVALFRFK